MSAPAFVNSIPVGVNTPVVNPAACSFVAPPAVRVAVHPPSTIVMRKQEPRDDGYVIKESDYNDGGTDQSDDSGDGFIGESEMDDLLGVSMPEDLASFEIRDIQNSQTRDELVSKLRDIKQRRRGIIVDRRKGIGMDNANNYLDKLS
eukprot:GO256238.1.p1 GENE.GO256238.1~~GO256238.1.p1  ORF type:complete len:164 (+),score=35.73 GO256238.1:54-494(+)